MGGSTLGLAFLVLVVGSGHGEEEDLWADGLQEESFDDAYFAAEDDYAYSRAGTPRTAFASAAQEKRWAAGTAGTTTARQQRALQASASSSSSYMSANGGSVAAAPSPSPTPVPTPVPTPAPTPAPTAAAGPSLPAPIKLAGTVGGFSRATFTAPYQLAWRTAFAATVGNGVTVGQVVLSAIADAVAAQRRRRLAAAAAVTFTTAVQLAAGQAAAATAVAAAVAAAAANATALGARFVAAQRATAGLAVIAPTSLALAVPTTIPAQWYGVPVPDFTFQNAFIITCCVLLVLLCIFCTYDAMNAGGGLCHPRKAGDGDGDGDGDGEGDGDGRLSPVRDQAKAVVIV